MRRYPTLVVALPSLLVSDLQAQEPPSARASGPAPVAAQQTASQTPPATPPEPSEPEWSMTGVIDATGSGMVVHRSDKAEPLMHVNRATSFYF